MTLLDNGDVLSLGGCGKQVEVGLRRKHPAIQVVRRSTGCELVQAWIDEIRADLEGLHSDLSSSESSQQADRYSGLAGSSHRSRDYARFHDARINDCRERYDQDH